MDGNYTPSLRKVAVTTKRTSLFGIGLIAGFIASLGCAHHPEASSATLHRPSSVQATVSETKPTVHVGYKEPSVNQSGGPLTDLEKTTIYYDLGAGRVLAKEIPATKPMGGGQVSQIIAVPGQIRQRTAVRICVTATNRNGNESQMTP